jgi:ferritin
MISKTMEKALNEQIREEVFSSYLYLAMRAWFSNVNYSGMARWMATQAKEEQTHAMKIFDYLLERGGVVELQAIDKPKKEWASPLQVLQESMAHERHITSCIHRLLETATAEKDYGTVNFLQWFVKEQVEEEGNVEPIVAVLEKVGDNLAAIYAMDHHLGKRGGE